MDISVEGRAVSFSGFLNERTDLNPVKAALERAAAAAGPDRVVLDFSKIEKANSCGILGYIKILRGTPVPILYVNAPIWLVEQFNIVEEFFEGDVLVTSVFARFYCPANDTMSIQLLTIGKEVPVLDDYEDFEMTLTSDDGKEIEPDFDSPSYFDFIARHAEHFRENIK